MGTNRYAYSLNDPVNRFDPGGNQEATETAAAATAGVACAMAEPCGLVGALGATVLGIGDILDDGYVNASIIGVDSESSRYASGEYTAEDMAVFRGAYTEANDEFRRTEQYREIRDAGLKYALFPAHVMPNVAEVDKRGQSEHGSVHLWTPGDAKQNRAAALRDMGRAGLIGRLSLKGVMSWEEYPPASMSRTAPATVGRVPLRENWVQGGFIRAAAITQGFVPGDRIMVVITP